MAGSDDRDRRHRAIEHRESTQSPSTSDEHQEQDGRRTTISAFSAEIEARFRVPLPPPDYFERYEHVVPGTGYRLLKLVEDELHERWDFKKRGQNYGALITLASLGSGTYLLSHDKNIQGLITLIVALTPLVGGFLGRLARVVEMKLLGKLIDQADEDGEDEDEA